MMIILSLNLNFKINSKMDTKDAPQIIEHITKSLTFTPFDTK